MQQDHEHDLWMRLIGIGSKPSKPPADSFVVARSRLAESLFAVRVVALLRRPIHHRAEHSVANVGKQRFDIELLTNARFKIRDGPSVLRGYCR